MHLFVIQQEHQPASASRSGLHVRNWFVHLAASRAQSKHSETLAQLLA